LNLYATLATIKQRIDIPDTLDDADLAAALATVSREIDRYCGRRFYVELATRYYGGPARACLRVDDLLSVTTLKTDPNSARTYPDVWATTDYDLDPPNALLESPPEPYTRIHLGPLGNYRFPSARRSIEIAGKWGYYEVLETVGATVVEALDTTETGIDVSNAALFQVGQTILVDDEQMDVLAATVNTAPTEDTLTVIRGINGTTAASHLTAAPIQRYTYPVVGEACAQQAILFFKGYAGTLGQVGQGGEFVQQIVTAGLHPFVQRSLETFRRMEVG
jgi:hypothetical protein